MLKKLWNDEAGVIVSAEIVLVATILVIALVTGLTSLRDAVNTELADVGGAIGAVSQTYSYGGITAHCASASGSSFTDSQDFCDGAAVGDNACNSRCIAICAPGSEVSKQ
jgi:Flp pilus assembly pilin Flp